MISYTSFKKYVSKLSTVHSSNNRTSYNDINVCGDLVYFKRGDSIKSEFVSLEELYQFYCKESKYNTVTAKDYITGRVQSPAVAILLAILDDINNADETLIDKLNCQIYYFKKEWQSFTNKERFNALFGLFVILFIGFSVIYTIVLPSNKINPNDRCYITSDWLGVYSTNDIPLLEYYCEHFDPTDIKWAIRQGDLRLLKKDEKCVCISSIRDGAYYMVRLNNSGVEVIVHHTRIKVDSK